MSVRRSDGQTPALFFDTDADGLMSFWRLFKRRGASRAVERWRADWMHAASNPEATAVRDLRVHLDQLAVPAEDLEIEREMLEGLEHLTRFASTVDRDGLPALTTGHRVVGSDTCHFTAPASMPDDPAQPSGRLLLTSARAIFVGGARSVTAPWHAVSQSLQTDRDLILIRVDGSALYRFRCNSFDDALCGAFVARQLTRPWRV